jgi:LPXTG-motif cell wall-anchored protein
MSATHRILVAGLPAAAAMFFAASPALATVDHPARPAASAAPCADGRRDGCSQGHDDGGIAAVTATAPAAGPDRGDDGYGNTPTTPSTPSTTHPTSPPPGTSPTASVFTVPPTSSSPTPGTGVKGASVKPSNGVSAGHALPVTGAPTGTIVAVGALMVAGGGASIWYTRRRRGA